MLKKDDIDFESSVFINCPYDADYDETFRLIVYTIRACGFIPRAAKENRLSDKSRLEKITGIIKDCRFAIHDLSRAELYGDRKKPRFNMPLELGLAMGAKYFGTGRDKRRVNIIVDTDRDNKIYAISDLMGFDFEIYEDDRISLVDGIRETLQQTKIDKKQLPRTNQILEDYKDVSEQIELKCQADKVSLDRITLFDLIKYIEDSTRTPPDRREILDAMFFKQQNDLQPNNFKDDSHSRSTKSIPKVDSYLKKRREENFR